MFRIDKNLVNLATQNVQANIEGETAGAAGLNNPAAPVLAAAREQAEEILQNAEAEAAEVIERARNEAKMIVRLAQDELEEERSRAWQTGYNEGLEEALASYNSKIMEDDEMLRSVLVEIHSERERMAGDLEDELVSLSLEIAKKIVNLAGEENDLIFESVIRNALRQIDIEGKITIRVGAKEYDRFFSSGSAVFSIGDGVAVTATVIKDPALGDGGLIIDSDGGTVNAGIDSQLNYVRLAFEKADMYEED